MAKNKKKEVRTFDGKKLKAKVNELEFFFSQPNNLKLIEKINSILVNEPIQIIVTEGATTQDAMNFISFKWWDLHPSTYCHLIYRFHKQPQKLMNWIGGSLNQFNLEAKKLCIDIMIEMIEDKRRFNFESESLNYVKEKLINFDLTSVYPDNISEGTNMIDYFTDGHPEKAEDVYEAQARMYGIVQSKKEEYMSYINNNLNNTFMEALSEFTFLSHGSTKQIKTNRETYGNEPFKWNKNTILLAYLINELKTYGFIEEDSIWKKCENNFVDKKGNSIKASTFTSFVKNYENNKTPDGRKGTPKDSESIAALITLLKRLEKDVS